MVTDSASLLSGRVGTDRRAVYLQNRVFRQTDPSPVQKSSVFRKQAAGIQDNMTGNCADSAAVPAEIAFFRAGLVVPDLRRAVQGERAVIRIAVNPAPVSNTGYILRRQGFVGKQEAGIRPSHPYPAAAVIVRRIACDPAAFQVCTECAGAGIYAQGAAFITRPVPFKAYVACG